MEQTFGIVENGKVRDMTPEEIKQLDAADVDCGSYISWFPSAPKEAIEGPSDA